VGIGRPGTRKGHAAVVLRIDYLPELSVEDSAMKVVGHDCCGNGAPDAASAPDASDAASAPDASDAASASDAPDASDAASAPDASDAASAPDASDAASASASSHAAAGLASRARTAVALRTATADRDGRAQNSQSHNTHDPTLLILARHCRIGHRGRKMQASRFRHRRPRHYLGRTEGCIAVASD